MRIERLLVPALAAALAAGCTTHWPHMRYDAFRTGHQPNASALSDPAQVPSLAVKWRFPKAGDPDLTGGFRASPVVWKDRVHIGNGNGRFYTLNATTGAMLWMYPPAGDPALTSQFTCNPSSFGIASTAAIATIGGVDASSSPRPTRASAPGSARGVSSRSARTTAR